MNVPAWVFGDGELVDRRYFSPTRRAAHAAAAGFVAIAIGACATETETKNDDLEAAPAYDLIEPKAPVLSPDAMSVRLANTINDYRASKGLSRVPLSRALGIVAKNHAQNIVSHKTEWSPPCNLHSWAAIGGAKACCYPDSHTTPHCMWDKPRELTGFPGNGFEIAVSVGSGTVTPEVALEMWRMSPHHHDVILNRGMWADLPFKSMGAGIVNGVGVVWFSDTADAHGGY